MADIFISYASEDRDRGGSGDKSPTVDLADLVAGVYHGSVISDAKEGLCNV